MKTFFILTFILGIPDIGDGVKIDAVIVTFALGKIGAGRSQKASFHRICKASTLGQKSSHIRAC